MKRRPVFAVLLGLALAWCGCNTDSVAPEFDNPFDPRNGQDLPVPDSLVVYVGNNLAQLHWGLPEGTAADEFAVFRRRLDVVESEALLKRTRERSYRDTGARNGRAYAYRVAAGQGGRFGVRSDALEARPGVFTIVIAGDAPKTRTRAVTVSFGAATGAFVWLYEDPASRNEPTWQQLTPSVAWTFRNSDDGEKTLFAVFQLQDGAETLPTLDTIVLDAHATIRSVDFEGADVRQPGDTVHFVLDAGEAGGTASLDVTGLYTALPLFDDGTNGDRAAGNGVYERDVILPAGTNTAGATLTGRFTDDVGNVAAGTTGRRTFTLRQSPEAVTLVEPAILAVPPDAAAVTLRWNPVAAADFASYQVFRSETIKADSASRPVGTVTNRTSAQFTDAGVTEGQQYFYRVYVVNSVGLLRGSVNTLGILVPNERPPREVALEPAASVGATRLSLRWSRSPDRDFSAYLLYRNEAGSVTPDDSLLCRIADINQIYWTELSLTDNTSYHYRVFVEDKGAPQLRSAPSNEIEAKTVNEPPADVRLLSATDVTSIAATLNWEASTDRSFALYRLYRSLMQPVTSDSTLVAVLAERETTNYRDTVIDPGMTYFYRLYVADEESALSKGSNTIEVTTPD